MAVLVCPSPRLLVVAVLAGTVFGAAVSSCATTSGGGPGGQAVNQPAPDLVMSKLTDGTAFNLAGLRGKVVLLDIWASWCLPCKEELPLLDDLAKRLGPRGIEVVAVSIDQERSNAEAFLRSRPGWSLLLAHDPEGRVPDVLKPPKMPTSYVIDAAGVVRHISAGFEPGVIHELEARLLELVGKPSAATPAR